MSASTFTVSKDPYITALDKIVNGTIPLTDAKILQNVSVNVNFDDNTSSSLSSVAVVFSQNTLTIYGFLSLGSAKTITSVSASATVRYHYGGSTTYYVDKNAVGTISGLNIQLSSGIYLIRIVVTLVPTTASVYL